MVVRDCMTATPRPIEPGVSRKRLSVVRCRLLTARDSSALLGRRRLASLHAWTERPAPGMYEWRRRPRWFWPIVLRTLVSRSQISGLNPLMRPAEHTLP